MRRSTHDGQVMTPTERRSAPTWLGWKTSCTIWSGIHGKDIAAVHPDHRPDAVNLVHYLALRHGDVRQLQRRLGERGLSSLGRCEPHVLATVESVRAALDGGAPQRRLRPL